LFTLRKTDMVFYFWQGIPLPPWEKYTIKMRYIIVLVLI